MSKSVLQEGNWYKRYSGAHRRAKMLRLKRAGSEKHGPLGAAAYAGIYDQLLDVMREATDFGIKPEHLDDVAFGLHFETQLVCDCVAACIAVGLLANDGRLHCPELRTEMAHREKNVETWRENAKRGGRPRKDETKNPDETKEKPNGLGGANQLPQPLPNLVQPDSSYISIKGGVGGDAALDAFFDPHTLTPNQSSELLMNYADGREEWLMHQVAKARSNLKANGKRIVDFHAYMQGWLLDAKNKYDDGPEHFGKPKLAPQRKSKTEQNLEILLGGSRG